MHHANGVVWEAVSPPPPPLPPLCAAPYPAVPRDGDDGAADDDAPRLWLLLFLEEEEPYPHRERFASFALLPRLVPAPPLDDGAAPASPRRILGAFHAKRRRGGVQRRQLESKGVERGDRKRGALGGERRREKSLRIGVHHANAVVWEPV